MELFDSNLAIYLKISFCLMYNIYSIVHAANQQFDLWSLSQKLDDLVGRPFSQLIAVNIVT